ncbi:hypothetical protein D6C78_03452 [Aureobasidium pullulans]|uniref:Uncharacterized protein n=1 Tax=Aureobasidium pullulans TaxID=5580 RepID=A0A4T0BX18_AURPU|nr:hypothetical protein D6C78_03452 [Aureobasidium pullulans]
MKPVPPFANHTPRAFEFQKTGKLHQTSAMFGPTGMAVPVMLPAGPAPSAKPAKPDVSASERSSTGGSVSYASSRADVRSQDESRPTSSELVAGEDSRNPFVDRMMTQTNLLVLPPSNPSYQMAYFLKTTGPVKEPPVKGARSKRISSAMRIFKGSSRRPSESLTAAHMRFVEKDCHFCAVLIFYRLNEVISEEKEELELETQATEKASHTSRKPLISPEPRLPEVVVPKISKTDQLSTDSLHDWVLGFEGAKTDTKPQEHEGPEALRGWPIKRISQTLPHEETIRVLDRKIVAPVRPLFLGTKARTEQLGADRHVRVIRGRTAPLRSHPVTPGPVPSIAPPALPENKASPVVADPVKAASLVQPSPRRLHDHPLVLQRTSSDVTGLRFSHLSQDGIRSVSDSPGPPPPRSPLRLSIPSESLGEMLGKSTGGTSPERWARDRTPINEEQAIRVTKEAAVTYVDREERDDDLPSFLRPGSSGTSSDVFCTNATQSKTGSSKPLELIDAMVKASQQNTSRRRLRRARPEGPRPLDLGGSHLQGSIERDQRLDGYCTSPLSMKRTNSMGDLSENYRIIATTASPSPRISHVRKAPSARGRNSPIPRVKTTKRGRGPKSMTSTPSRASSPSKKTRQSTTPELPSPPPQKELPPTPRAKSDRLSRMEATLEIGLARTSSTRNLPAPPAGENGRSMMFPSPPSSAKTARFKLQAGENSPLTIEARMEALERRNKLLEAALSAVLKTGGTLNGCPCQASHAEGHDCQEAVASEPLVARGSVRSRVSSVSNGSSALDVYLNTRGK